MSTTNQDPRLLTPGPLTTAAETKEAMLHDWGSRDEAFMEANRRVRDRLVSVVHAEGSHVCVPVQGSGTFSVEATLGTLVPRDGKALVLVNGAYGRRMESILDTMGRSYLVLEGPEDEPTAVDALEAALLADGEVTHVLAVYCETTTGILNPIAEIAAVTARFDVSLLIDAMSAFGALDLDARKIPFDAVMASSNKNLEGVPGLGFAIIRKSVLETAEGNAHSLSLDLYDQWVAMEKTGQWRFTPPTHVVMALDTALNRFDEEGGVEGRHARYAENCTILVSGMRELGFETLLPDETQAPIIITFRMPADPAFDFARFYAGLKQKGYVIYPGKLTDAPSFRMGCIGALGSDDMRGALAAVRTVMDEMGVASGSPAP